jgi:hypothetical protein
MNLNHTIAKIIPITIKIEKEITPLEYYMNMGDGIWIGIFGKEKIFTNSEYILPVGWVKIKSGKFKHFDIIASEVIFYIVDNFASLNGVVDIEIFKKINPGKNIILRHPSKLNNN